MISFKNKNILITGASGGIGNALVKKFVALEGNVLGTGTKAEKLDMIKKQCPNIKVKKFDISEHSRIEEFIDNVVLELGGLDILINNAGTNVDNLSLRMKDDEWDYVITTNLSALFRITKHCLRAMIKARWGRIVNLTSVVGAMGNPGQSNYAAAKAGIVGYSKSLAQELGSRGITVNSIAPGLIGTDMTDALAEEIREDTLKNIPLGRFGAVEDIATAVAFLCSNSAAYITGQVLSVDGGLSMC